MLFPTTKRLTIRRTLKKKGPPTFTVLHITVNFPSYLQIHMTVYRTEIYLPAWVNLDISKSGICTLPLANMYSIGSVMKRFQLWLLPAPDSPTKIQNRFKQHACVRNKPFVFGPKQLATNGNIVPI